MDDSVKLYKISNRLNNKIINMGKAMAQQIKHKQKKHIVSSAFHSYSILIHLIRAYDKKLFNDIKCYFGARRINAVDVIEINLDIYDTNSHLPIYDSKFDTMEKKH